MTKKIQITQEQKNAIERTIKHEVQEDIVRYIAKKEKIPNYSYQSLSELKLADLLKVLYVPNSYEVLPTYKDGDKIYYYKDGKGLQGVYTVKRQLVGIVETYEKGENGIHFALCNIRLATKEDLMWNNLGRKVGEFKDGDVITKRNDMQFSVERNPNESHSKEWYEKGELKGFYPVESFIRFEEGEN